MSRRVVRVFARGGAACLVVSLFACAKGSDLEPAGSGAGAASTTSGDGGAAGHGDGGMSAMTSTSETVTSTTGPPCEEQPCKLVSPQCGCPPDEQCTIDGSSERSCVDGGATTIGAECNSEECVPGAMCVGFGVPNTCHEFCETDAECDPPGGKCSITLNDGSGGTVPDVALCTENCDPILNNGCFDVDGLACQIGVTETDEIFTLCRPAGTGLFQAVCTDSDDCAPGHVCLTQDTELRCFAWCQVGGAICAGGLTCSGLEISPGVPLTIGNVTYGACL